VVDTTGRILYDIAHVVFYALARTLFRLRVIGGHHIPEKGGILIAANHASYVDIPLIGCAMKRRVNFMGKASLFHVPILGWFYRTMGGFPITQFHSRGKMGEAIRRLEAGEVVVLYPEGERSQDGRLLRGMPGIGLIVAHTKAPVVPAYIAGTHKVLPVGSKWPRPYPVTVIFGQPIDFKYLLDTQRSDRQLYRAVSERVMTEIRQLAVEVGAVEEKWVKSKSEAISK
jgi:1-acyl-sn-glycerol-3-phosphate acyltransferase